MYAERLTELATALGFDGWLINMEVNLDVGRIPNLKEFIIHLTTTMHSSVPGSLVIWYDSVTVDGKLSWQDQLNDSNKPFFDICDGIFVNYTWQEDYPKLSAAVAGNRKFDVYMGIDVFGRNTYGGGQWDTNVALDVLKKDDVSAAIFAPGWVYETKQPPDFQTAQNRWWALIEKSWGIVQNYPQVLPFYSNFDQGRGYHISVDGGQVSSGSWNNISSQSFQPFLEFFEDPPSESIEVFVDRREASYSGGSSITFKGTLQGTYFTRRLFQGDLLFGDLPVHFTYSVKSDGSSLIGLSLKFSSSTNEKTSVLLASHGNALLTMNQFSSQFSKIIMPRQVTKPETDPGWVIQDSSITMNGSTLTEIHAVCYHSKPELNRMSLKSQPDGVDNSLDPGSTQYFAILGHFTVKTPGQNLDFPPSTSWLVEGQYINWTSGSQGSNLAATVAAFARMTVHDSRKILPAEFYPSWVVFSHRQKLNWLNVQLEKIWPYVNEAASELIRSSVEPILEQYRPVILSSLKFSKLTLGTVAPQFTGVSILEGDAKGITMELEMEWDGNPNIVLDIKTKVGVGLPIQVKNIGFSGLFRLIFRPLVDEFPCFGAVCFSLREKKNLDFTLKVVGGDLSAIPGISDAIEDTIRDAIEDSITWPVRQIIPILPGDYSDLELKPVGTLDVKLIQAKGLTNKDIIGKSDPYAVIFIRPVRDRMKTSKTINNQLNPIWNEHFDFIVEDESTQYLTIRVFDDEGVQASELIGCAHVALKDLEPGKVKDVWLKLVKDLVIQRDNKDRGQVHLELLFCPFGTVSGLTNPFNTDFRLTSLEKALKSGNDGTEAADIAKSSSQRRKDVVIVRGVLSVTVITAENLPAVDLMGKSDPFVVLVLKKSEQKHKTRVVNNTLNPVWNQTFDFVVEDGLHDLLITEVYDHDTFGKDKMGRCIMTLTRVILEGEFTDTFPIDGTKSGILHLHLKWTPQPLPRDP